MSEVKMRKNNNAFMCLVKCLGRRHIFYSVTEFTFSTRGTPKADLDLLRVMQ